MGPSYWAAEKNKEKVEAKCTGFSAEWFCFVGKTKMMTTSCRIFTKPTHVFLNPKNFIEIGIHAVFDLSM